MDEKIVNMCIKMDSDLRDALKIQAVKEGKKLKYLVMEVLENYLKEKEGK